MKYIIRLCTGLILIATPFFSVSQSFTIQANSSTDVCYPSCVPLSVVSPITNNSYQWYLETYSCSTPTSTNSLTSGTSLNACGNGIFYCISTNPNGVKDTSNRIPIRVLPSTPGWPDLPLAYPTTNVNCEDSITLCIPDAFLNNFTSTVAWYLNNAIIQGATSNTFVANSPGNYHYQITNACTTAVSATITLNSPPSKPVITSSHPSPVCSNQDVTYSVVNPSGNIYSWESFNGSFYVGVDFGTSTVITAPSIGSLNVRVTEISTGCQRSSDAIISVVELNIPQVSASSPTLAFCGGQSVNIMVTAGLPSSNFSYQWYRNNSIISGANSSTYATKKGGSYYVTSTAACGTKTSGILSLTKYPSPTVIASAASNPNICKLDSVELLSSISGTAPFTLQWKKYSNDIIGETNQNYFAKTSGNYKLIVVDNNGCARASNKVNVKVLGLPPAVISAGGPTQFCDGDKVDLTANSGTGFTYQWKNYSTLLPNATSQTLSATFSGKFKCLVSNIAGCVRASNAINVFTFPCPERLINIEEVFSDDFSVTAFPNPSEGEFNLKIDGHNSDPVKLMIYDISGRYIDSEIKAGSSNIVKINDLDKGIYFVDVTIGNTTKRVKLISLGN